MPCPQRIAISECCKKHVFRPAVGLMVMVVVCLVLVQTGCKKDRISQPAPAKPSSAEPVVQDKVPSPSDHGPDQGSEVAQLERERSKLEGQAADLRHRIAELTEANRRLVEKFQQRDADETIFAGATGREGREAVVAGTGVAYFWDKPGGYGTGAVVAGQIRAGEKVVVVDETVMRGQRWYEIYTTAGTVFKSGWAPADVVALVPTSGNTNE